MLQKTVDGNQVFVMGSRKIGTCCQSICKCDLCILDLVCMWSVKPQLPAVLPQDVVFAISGSGETRTIADLGK